jgi:hypothetical protein
MRTSLLKICGGTAATKLQALNGSKHIGCVDTHQPTNHSINITHGIWCAGAPGKERTGMAGHNEVKELAVQS